MATTIAKYVDGCMKIVEAKPAYVHGGSDLKECDCIGMSKYSFRINKVTFSTSGTNYSYRNQIDNARAISSASDLNIGDVVSRRMSPDSPDGICLRNTRKAGASTTGTCGITAT